MITEDDLDARLGLADPARSRRVTPSTLDGLLATAGEAERLSRPRVAKARRLRGWAIAGAVVLGLGAAVPAAAAVREFLSVTDWTCLGTECGVDEVWVDASVDDFGEYVASVYPDYLALPPGIDVGEVVEWTAADLAADEPTLVARTSIERRFEQVAICVWADEWIRAHDAGDLPARDRATDVLEESTAWPAHVATDGAGLMERQRRMADAAASGDRGGVRTGESYNGCSHIDRFGE